MTIRDKWKQKVVLWKEQQNSLTPTGNGEEKDKT